MDLYRKSEYTFSSTDKCSENHYFKIQRRNQLSSLPGVASQDGNDGSSLAEALTRVPCWSTQKHTDASHCTGKYFPSGVQCGT